MVSSKGSYPDWMEFAEEGPAGVIRLVGRTGSVHPASDVKVEGSHLTFTSPEGAWDITAGGHKLSGTVHSSKGAEVQLSGVLAPALNDQPPPRGPRPSRCSTGKT